MTEWKSIDTAPKNGTSILVYRRWKKHQWLDHGYDHYIEIAYWKDDDWWIHAFCPPASNDPTHWMPLPEPPKLGTSND
jgi:hypothetical protein